MVQSRKFLHHQKGFLLILFSPVCKNVTRSNSLVYRGQESSVFLIIQLSMLHCNLVDLLSVSIPLKRHKKQAYLVYLQVKRSVFEGNSFSTWVENELPSNHHSGSLLLPLSFLLPPYMQYLTALFLTCMVFEYTTQVRPKLKEYFIPGVFKVQDSEPPLRRHKSDSNPPSPKNKKKTHTQSTQPVQLLINFIVYA